MDKQTLKKEIEYYNNFWQTYPRRIKNTLFNYHGICRHNAILSIVKKLNVKNSRFLDIGCGSGLLTSKLVKFSDQITGIDFSKTAIEIAQQRFPKIKFQNVDVSNKNELITKLSPSYDVIILSEVIEHIEDKKTLFKSVYSLLSNQGYFILTTPNADLCTKYNIMGNQYREEYISSYDIIELSNGLFEMNFKGSTYFINPTRKKPVRLFISFLKVKIFRQILKPTEEGLYLVFLFSKIPSSKL